MRISDWSSDVCSSDLHAQTRRFEDDFWSGGDLSMLQQAVASRRDEQGALARIFDAGMTEFLKARRTNANGDVNPLLDGPRRAMRAAYQREMASLEANLNFLASSEARRVAKECGRTGKSRWDQTQ